MVRPIDNFVCFNEPLLERNLTTMIYIYFSQWWIWNSEIPLVLEWALKPEHPIPYDLLSHIALGREGVELVDPNCCQCLAGKIKVSVRPKSCNP